MCAIYSIIINSTVPGGIVRLAWHTCTTFLHEYSERCREQTHDSAEIANSLGVLNDCQWMQIAKSIRLAYNNNDDDDHDDDNEDKMMVLAHC